MAYDWRSLGLLLLLSLCVACPSPNRSVDNSNATASEDAGPSQGDSAPIAGKYQCRWRLGDKGLDLPCEISKDKGHKTLTMIVSDRSLQGRASTTDYGFHFAGTLKNSATGATEALEADFFQQGAGAYATVLTLADKSLVKLDLHP